MKSKTRRVFKRRPVEWRQLCAIARELIEAEPTIDNFEWSERLKTRIIQLGFTYPSPLYRLGDAMDAVARALEKKWGPRPVPPLPRSSGPWEVLRQVDPPWPRTGRGPQQPWTSVKALLASLKVSPSSGNSSES